MKIAAWPNYKSVGNRIQNYIQQTIFYHPIIVVTDPGPQLAANLSYFCTPVPSQRHEPPQPPPEERAAAGLGRDSRGVGQQVGGSQESKESRRLFKLGIDDDPCGGERAVVVGQFGSSGFSEPRGLRSPQFASFCDEAVVCDHFFQFFRGKMDSGRNLEQLRLVLRVDCWRRLVCFVEVQVRRLQP